MKIQILLKKTSEWLNGKGPEADLVITSRVRLARNLKGYKFPWKAEKRDKKHVCEMVQRAAADTKALKDGSLFINMDEMDELDRQFLVERHLISPELATSQSGSGVIISKNETVSIMINEEDHLRMQVMHSGLQLYEVWQVIDEMDSELQKHLNFAFTPKLGFLSVCPTNVGTGIRVSVMLHLPALVYTKQINKVLQATIKLGLAVRGLYGEGSEALGNLFQISNQATLGLSETEIIDNISKVIKQVITYERNQRRYLINHNLKEVEDKVFRSFGILTNARMINSKETIGHLSTLRMGIDLGILDTHYRKKVNELMILTQPAHLQKSLDRILGSGERDAERANLIRQTLKVNNKSGNEKG